MRTTILTTASLLGLALLSPMTAASAAGETCRGEAATIVGTGATITGTEGRDVVVTNGVSQVNTLGGDDVICVTGGGSTIFAGPGDDVVDSTTAHVSWGVRAVLGEGADRFDGGASGGVVNGGSNSLPHADTEKDVILGAGGVTSGELGQPNPDVIVLTDNDDTLYYSGITTAGGSIDGGAGDDSFYPSIRNEPGDTVIDNAAGQIRLDGQVVANMSGFETFWTERRDGHELGFVGTAADETVYATGTGKVNATFGGGDDEFRSRQAPSAGSALDGGEGRDLFYVTTDSGLLDLDMQTGRLVTEAGSDSSSATGFEDASLFAHRVVLAGTDGGNHLAFSACDANLRGRRGPDTFTYSRDVLFETASFCPLDPKTRMNGGRGRDDLQGTRGNDALRGGKGNDRLEGNDGNDRLVGGKGRDTIKSGKGRDFARGGRGHDDLKGQQGQDTLRGGRGHDKANGGQGGRDLCRAERERGCEL